MWYCGIPNLLRLLIVFTGLSIITLLVLQVIKFSYQKEEPTTIDKICLGLVISQVPLAIIITIGMIDWIIICMTKE